MSIFAECQICVAQILNIRHRSGCEIAQKQILKACSISTGSPAKLAAQSIINCCAGSSLSSNAARKSPCPAIPDKVSAGHLSLPIVARIGLGPVNPTKTEILGTPHPKTGSRAEQSEQPERAWKPGFPFWNRHTFFPLTSQTPSANPTILTMDQSNYGALAGAVAFSLFLNSRTLWEGTASPKPGLAARFSGEAGLKACFDGKWRERTIVLLSLSLTVWRLVLTR